MCVPKGVCLIFLREGVCNFEALCPTTGIQVGVLES